MVSTRRARNALAGVRGTFGTVALVAPGLTARAFGIDATAQPAVRYLVRLFGARDVLMAHQLVSAVGEDEAEEALRGGIVVDVADLLAVLAATARGQVSARTGLLGATGSAASLALGLLGRSRGAADRLVGGEPAGTVSAGGAGPASRGATPRQ
jgi:hypothetical protein